MVSGFLWRNAYFINAIREHSSISTSHATLRQTDPIGKRWGTYTSLIAGYFLVMQGFTMQNGFGFRVSS